MPSPVGHALAGLAAGWMVQGAPPVNARSVWWREAALFGGLGMLADVDLLFGSHSGPTHGLGTAVVVGLLAFAVWPATGVTRGLAALACALAYASHTLLDWLGTDSSPPIGIMALWPWSRDYFESGIHLFMAVSRRYWQGGAFWRHNLAAFGRELVILGPALIIVLFLRRRAESAKRGQAP
jgi:inner membrane protein